MTIWVILKCFKKSCLVKKTFLTSRKITAKEYEHFLNIWNKFEMKTMKGYHDLYLKCDVLLLANVFKNLEIMAQQIMGYI